MSQTILVENNDELQKSISQNLETLVGAEVIVRKNAEETIELLRILPEVSLVITQSKIGDEETAKLLHLFIQSESLPISLLVIGDCPDLKQEVSCLEEPLNVETLIQLAAYHLGHSSLNNFLHTDDYHALGLHYFYDIQQSPCDVYIRIKKGPAEFQFIKRLNSNDTFDRWDIDRYSKQGLKEFYISKADYPAFSLFITNELTKKLKRDDLPLEDMILTIANAHQIVREKIQTMGLDDESAQLSEASIQSMVTSVIYSPKMSILLKFIISSKMPYAYQICHLESLICHYILTKQSWYKLKHLETLSFVAFFADVALPKNEQIKIRSMSELMNTSFEDEEKHQVLKHPKESMTLVEKHPMITEFTKVIILESHGRKDGRLEDVPEDDLHLLSKIFIIADDFVKILLEPELPSSKKDILPLLYERYSHPSYQKIIKTLEQKF